MADNKEIPQAPLAIENAAHNEDGAGVTSLEVGGVAVKLDSLGPMIINSDGTVSRITNWGEMGEIERERTVRLLVKKRNLVRLNQLDAQGAGGEGEEKLSAIAASTKENS